MPCAGAVCTTPARKVPTVSCRTEQHDEISKHPTARQALIDLVAHAVARQIPAALALQERIRERF